MSLIDPKRAKYLQDLKDHKIYPDFINLKLNKAQCKEVGQAIINYNEYEFGPTEEYQKILNQLGWYYLHETEPEVWENKPNNQYWVDTYKDWYFHPTPNEWKLHEKYEKQYQELVKKHIKQTKVR